MIQFVPIYSGAVKMYKFIIFIAFSIHYNLDKTFKKIVFPEAEGHRQ